MSAPVKVYQCKDDCCAVQVPAKRMWYVETAGVRDTAAHFPDAIELAAADAALIREAQAVS